MLLLTATPAPVADYISTSAAGSSSTSTASSSSTSTASSSSTPTATPLAPAAYVEPSSISSSTPTASPLVPAAYVEPSSISSSTPTASPSMLAAYMEPSSTSSSTMILATASPSSGYGITYNQYNRDGSCKTEGQVATDFGYLGSFPLIRIYGTDCNGPYNVLSACKATGKKLFLGIFSLDDLTAEVTIIVNAVESLGGDYELIHTISIGNELVNQGIADAGTVMSAVATARGLLRAAGYSGPVVTVDTLNAAVANPTLCDKSDYCAVNCHPFFEANAVPSGAGSFLTSQITSLKNVLSNKSQSILITETGWPSSATGEKASVASPSDQTVALNSIKAAFSSNQGGVILFSSFNREWVKDPGEYDQEEWWGILGDCPSG